MADKSAIEKMVEWLDDRINVDHFPINENDILEEARRLALEEAKEKPPASASLVEELADLEHRRWSHWQEWCHKVLREQCPSEAMEKVLARWDKQIATEYKDLSEREKEMDRIEARKSLNIFSRYRPQTDIVGEIKEWQKKHRDTLVRTNKQDEELDEIIAKYEEEK